MQKNKLYIVILCCVCIFWANAQVTDVFQNTAYEYSTRVFKASFDKDYAPGTVEILQDKLDGENSSQESVEVQLYNLAVANIENVVSFFQIQTKASNALKNADAFNELQESYYEPSEGPPDFSSIEIKLVSMVNGLGVYCIQYLFEDEIKVAAYYLADYPTNKLTLITDAPNNRQQQMLKKLTLAKFTANYLLQTKKLTLDNVARIEATRSGKEVTPDVAAKIDYTEAIVYPYFSGLMVEFPKNTKSSLLFGNDAFRLLIKGNELQQLLTVYPEFKKAFSATVTHPSEATIALLNNDANFDLRQFIRPPRGFDLFEGLRNELKAKPVFSVTINNYQQFDTVRRFIGATKYFLSNTDKIIRLENRNEANNVSSEKKYTYNANATLASILHTGSENELELLYYNEQLPDYTETIEINDFGDSYELNRINMEIAQQHYLYNGKNRYILHLELIGDLDRNTSVQKRYIDGTNLCTQRFCLLTNAQGKIVGINQKQGSPIDILMNNNNQPIECFDDNDTDHYWFTYDTTGRLKAYNAIAHNNKTNTVFEYQPTKDIALRITETKSGYTSTTVVQEYELVYAE